MSVELPSHDPMSTLHTVPVTSPLSDRSDWFDGLVSTMVKLMVWSSGVNVHVAVFSMPRTPASQKMHLPQITRRPESPHAHQSFVDGKLTSRVYADEDAVAAAEDVAVPEAEEEELAP